VRLAIALLLAACTTARPAEVDHRDAAPSPPVARSDAPSIYDLALPLLAAGGTTIELDADRGHPTLISMFYGTCPAACPALIDAIGRTLDRVDRRDVRVLLVSFDPARDTPAQLRELARVHRLDARWTLASAGEADARALAAVLGIRYRTVANGQFFHTSAIVVLDRDGRPVAHMDGLGDPSGLVAALADHSIVP
jgi:protein SCO1/2